MHEANVSPTSYQLDACARVSPRAPAVAPGGPRPRARPVPWVAAPGTPPRPAYLQDPTARDARYAGNNAQYLVDLHDAAATFDFCGGMYFQLKLSDALRAHLITVAKDPASPEQPVIHDANAMRIKGDARNAQRVQTCERVRPRRRTSCSMRRRGNR